MEVWEHILERLDRIEKRLEALKPDNRLIRSMSSVTGTVCISCSKVCGGYMGVSACERPYCPFNKDDSDNG